MVVMVMVVIESDNVSAYNIHLYEFDSLPIYSNNSPPFDCY